MKRKSEASTTMPVVVQKLRCAVYTRKSTDEGLEKTFNSLDAQGEACAAYIESQKAEGWVQVADRYDDGGFSGATLDRPALQRLIQDVKAGRIGIVIVYKIDRLSRSLRDFVKLIELFEVHGVTFVSVTQSFNTTTSMGRLILNVLLSFAQFEREVIGDRIRDKIAASRARGMWMGGKVPLGYDVRDRKLIVNEAEAERVRRVFEVFAETGSGIATLRRMAADGMVTKTGRPFSRSDLYKLLSNRTYLGEVTHKGHTYPGAHLGIVSRQLWDRVHDILTESPRARANQNRQQTPALLKGLLFGADGRAMSPTHTRRRGRLYRYYVSQFVLKGSGDMAADVVRRVSAAEIETAVVNQVRLLLRQPEIIVGTWMAARAEAPDLTEAETRQALEQLDPLWDQLFPAEQARIIHLLVERVEVGPDGAAIRLRIAGLTGLVDELRSVTGAAPSEAA